MSSASKLRNAPYDRLPHRYEGLPASWCAVLGGSHCKDVEEEEEEEEEEDNDDKTTSTEEKREEETSTAEEEDTKVGELNCRTLFSRCNPFCPAGLTFPRHQGGFCTGLCYTYSTCWRSSRVMLAPRKIKDQFTQS